VTLGSWGLWVGPEAHCWYVEVRSTLRRTAGAGSSLGGATLGGLTFWSRNGGGVSSC
jgi:hypothetical protein